jgi:AAA15 family ATPase/GTPase
MSNVRKILIGDSQGAGCVHIGTFRIENYKSFRDSGEVKLSEGFNVIVGPNNAGKTAIIDGLELRFQNHPHRSLRTAPNRTSQLDDISSVTVTFEIGRSELAILLADETPHIHFPVDPGKPQEPEAERFIQTFATRDPHTVQVRYTPDGQNRSIRIEGFVFPRSIADEGQKTLVFKIDREKNCPVLVNTGAAQRDSLFPRSLADLLRNRIYRFNAERYNLGRSRIRVNSTLSPDASNLASVLHVMQLYELENWKRLNRAVSLVFPDIKHVASRLVSDDEVEVVVSSVAESENRPDLALPLSQCGTGIGQVISVIAVALVSTYPQVILIDEPQTFLHPGAIRKLFDVLKFEGGHEHQYVVTTHSPVVISAAEPTTVLRVHKPEAESHIEVVDLREDQHLRDCLAEVGARPSDVFGADNVLWVEGPTEEVCFPKILTALAGRRSPGTSILAVRSTGDLEGRFAEKFLDIYHRLSAGGGLQPAALGFVFDKESRSAQEREELRRRLKGKLHFLPVRMFENYLVDPRAIVAVASSIDEFFSDQGTDPYHQVQSWLNDNLWCEKYFRSPVPEAERSPEKWREEAHGAELLSDIFSRLSEGRFPYEKVTYGALLTDWIVENAPERLEELSATLTQVIEDGAS